MGAENHRPFTGPVPSSTRVIPLTNSLRTNSPTSNNREGWHGLSNRQAYQLIRMDRHHRWQPLQQPHNLTSTVQAGQRTYKYCYISSSRIRTLEVSGSSCSIAAGSDGFYRISPACLGHGWYLVVKLGCVPVGATGLGTEFKVEVRIPTISVVRIRGIRL